MQWDLRACPPEPAPVFDPPQRPDFDRVASMEADLVADAGTTSTRDLFPKSQSYGTLAAIAQGDVVALDPAFRFLSRPEFRRSLSTIIIRLTRTDTCSVSGRPISTGRGRSELTKRQAKKDSPGRDIWFDRSEPVGSGLFRVFEARPVRLWSV